MKKWIDLLMYTHLVGKIVVWITNPIITIYFMHQIQSGTLSMANFAGALVSIFVLDRYQNAKTIQKSLEYYPAISVINVIAFIITNVICMPFASLRMILNVSFASVVNNFTSMVWSAKFNTMFHGNERTALDSRWKKYKKIGKLIGSCIGMYLVSMHWDLAPSVAIYLATMEVICSCVMFNIIYRKLK